MPKILTAATILASFIGRNNITPAEPSPRLITASAEEPEKEDVHVGRLDMVEAMAVKGFAQVSGSLQWIKAKEHFGVAGGAVYAGDYVQVPSDDAKRLVAAGRADLSTDEEVAAASAPAGKAKA